VIGRRWAEGLAVLVLVLSGCTQLAPVFKPASWDNYGDSGPLAVRGAARDAPGPTIVRALRLEPKLTPVLDRYGEPDTVQVNGGRYQSKQLVLVYRRPAQRIVVERAADGWVARAPELLPSRSRRATARVPAHAGEAPAPLPTMAQSLECPIDPSRPDCQALCASGATHEWCR
jgi:hypothetical protein